MTVTDYQRVELEERKGDGKVEIAKAFTPFYLIGHLTQTETFHD